LCSRTLQSLTFEDAFDIPFAVQNPDHADSVTVHQVINADCLESGDGPETQVLKLRAANRVVRPKKGLSAERLHSQADGIAEAYGNFRNLQGHKIIPELANTSSLAAWR
jgi:hypothetical protein